MSAETSRPLGILGGTFDPIHFGHLRLAQEVAQTLDLQAVRFIPGGTPPHRDAPQTSAAHRVAMVKLAIAGNPLFVLDERETRRSGPSYSFDTLAEVRAEIGASQPLVMIMGGDAFLAFHKWHRWQDIFDVAHIAVAHRPGAPLGTIADPALGKAWLQRRANDPQSLHRAAAGAIIEVPITALDISATAIRRTLAAGLSARYLTAPDVLSYISDNSLFLNNF